MNSKCKDRELHDKIAESGGLKTDNQYHSKWMETSGSQGAKGIRIDRCYGCFSHFTHVKNWSVTFT